MSMISDAIRLYDTVKHLLPSQVAALAFFAARRRIVPAVCPKLTSTYYRVIPQVHEVNNELLGTWAEMLQTFLPLPSLRQNAYDLLSGRPSFIGHTLVTNESVPDWHPKTSPSRLWDYHLHYLDCLPGLAASICRGAADSDKRQFDSLVSSWEQQNPLGSSPGWDPYPTSLRIVNLLRSAALIPSSDIRRNRLLTMATRQALTLLSMVEWHLQGNHLWANAKALVLAGAVFQHSRLALPLWFLGKTLLHRELTRQFLSDGGHFERSPMYHLLLLRDLNELMTVLPESRQPGAEQLTKLCRLRYDSGNVFFGAVRHPDGNFPHFNDTAQFQFDMNHTVLKDQSRRTVHIATGVERVTNTTVSTDPPRATERLPTLITFPETGYSVAKQGDWVVLFDHGEIGPDEQPGHAHADLLSVEISCRGQRLFINGGTGGYADYPWRNNERRTSNHNTVQFGDHDPVELWGNFRVGKRSVPVLRNTTANSGRIQLVASCTWVTLDPSPTHCRSVSVTETAIEIIDRVRPAGHYKAIIRYHLAPEWSVFRSKADQFLIRYKDNVVIMSHNARVATIGTTLYAPSFGLNVERPCVFLIVPPSGECVVNLRIRG